MTEQDLWNGNFHSILLYSTLEYFLSDFKNIKEFLYHISKYIENKKINGNKVNNVLDLEGIGKATWNFISTIYNSE